MIHILKTGLRLVVLSGLALGVPACVEEDDGPIIATNPYPDFDALPDTDAHLVQGPGDTPG
jgi:hypothetical protein